MAIVFLIANWVVAASEVAAASAVAPGQAIVATAGQPEVVDSFRPSSLFENLQEYEEQTHWHPPDVPVHEWPESLAPGARYGVVQIGSQRLAYVLTAPPHTLIVDLDGDGSLAGDPRWPLAHETLGQFELFSTTLAGDRPGLPMKLAFPFLEGKPTGSAFEFPWTVRRGEIPVGERSLAFALVGARGLYSDPLNALILDLDADGQLNLDDNDPERFLVHEGRVNIDGHGYAFTIDPKGDSLTLTPIDESVPPRSSLAVATAAPDFSFVDIDQARGSLADYRGRVVLLYFWYAGCAPCSKLLPQVAELYDAFHALGLEVLAINTSDAPDVIREYVSAKKFPGRQLPDGNEGQIASLFRVRGVPQWFLIDRDGRIASRMGSIPPSTLSEAVRALCLPPAAAASPTPEP